MKKGLLAAILLTLVTLALIFIFANGSEGNSQDDGGGKTRKAKFSGTAATQIRELRQFEKVHASTGIDVYLIKSDSLYAEVTADEKIIDLVRTDVSNGKLRITYDHGITLPVIRKKHVKTEVRVYTPDITDFEITADSAADIYIGEGFVGESVQMEATSASGIKGGGINYNLADLSATSGADIELWGKCMECTVEVTSGADVDTKKLECENVTVSATSGADAKVWATQSIDATATSGADIEYYGNPVTADITDNSGGSVRHK